MNATETHPSAAGSLVDRVLLYNDIIKSMTIRSKQPGFTTDAWDELAELVAVDEFVRVGRFKEQMGWQQCVEMMDKWARDASFANQVSRISQAGNMVFLEVSEQNEIHGEAEEMVTMTVIEFNEAGKICRLDFFQ